MSLNWIDLRNTFKLNTLVLPSKAVSDILVDVAWKGESELTALYSNRVQNVVNNINFPLQNKSGYIVKFSVPQNIPLVIYTKLVLCRKEV